MELQQRQRQRQRQRQSQEAQGKRAERDREIEIERGNREIFGVFFFLSVLCLLSGEGVCYGCPFVSFSFPSFFGLVCLRSAHSVWHERSPEHSKLFGLCFSTEGYHGGEYSRRGRHG